MTRAPLNQGSYQQPSGPPTAIQEGQECSVLPQLRAAYYQLLAGGQTASIRDGDREQRFSRGDAKFMQQEIRRLGRMCEGHHRPFAIRAGGLNRRGWGCGGGYGGY